MCSFLSLPKINLKKIQGRWFEIYRKDNWFQKKDDIKTRAYYIFDGEFVHITNITIRNGKKKEVVGIGQTSNKFNSCIKVYFNIIQIFIPFLYGKYEFLYVLMDDSGEYETMVVGDSNLKTLWVLNREKKIKKKNELKVEKFLNQFDLSLSQLIFTKQI